jgi:hypothetical protein
MLDWRGLALATLLLLTVPASAKAGEASWDLWGTLVIEGAGDKVALSGPAAGQVRAALAQPRAAAPAHESGRTLADHLREYRWREETARSLEQTAGQGQAAGFAPQF